MPTLSSQKVSSLPDHPTTTAPSSKPSTATPSLIARRGRLFSRLRPVIILLILVLIAFRGLAFSDWIMARGDTYSYHYPYWHLRNAAFLNGELPLWTPDLFMGAPLLANPQIGTFYPPNWIVAPLSPPDGVRLSVLLHIFWTALGGYVLARQVLHVGEAAAIFGAVVFALGGHIGAHVEQINQLQGLSWLAWALVLLDLAGTRPVRGGLLLAMALALQIFSGHTQTVFITGVTLGLYALCTRPLRGVLTVAAAGVGALLLATPQIIPTLELSGLSNRSGGFNVNQATAFSFNPFVTARGLLPSYDRMIFSEYIAYPGIIGMALAWWGALATPPLGGSHGRIRRSFSLPQTRWIVIAFVGLAFAYGVYNPVYWLLAGLPGFNLFRVPARWLVLFSLGVAMLAALGVDHLLTHLTPRRRWHVAAFGGFLIGIIGLGLLSPLVTRTPDLTPSYPPEMITWVGWIAAWVITLVGFGLIRQQRASPRLRRRGMILWIGAGVVELLLASGALAYNQLVPPDAFTEQRFSISQMLVYSEAVETRGRLLSFSDLAFDPGDRAALERRYEALGITGETRALAFDTVKLREVLAANLNLLWGIPSIDGFDGGLLPTGNYTAFTSLLLPPGEMRTLDGRLREVLYHDACGGACLPDQRWLNLTGTRYLLNDKVYDLVREGIFFDTTFGRTGGVQYPNPTGFVPTVIDLLYACSADPCLAPTVFSDDIPLPMLTSDEPLERYRFARYALPDDTTVETINVQTSDQGIVRAVTLAHLPSNTFQQLTPAPFRRVLSSDIKLYENTFTLPNTFFVYAVNQVADDIYGTEAALQLMRHPSFDASQMAVIASNTLGVNDILENRPSPSGMGQIQEVSRTATRSAFQVNTTQAGLFVQTDAHYPGWVATLDGATTPILRADVMFRGVIVPAGSHTLIFEYRPWWFPGILIFGIGAWLTSGIILMWHYRKTRLRAVSLIII